MSIGFGDKKTLFFTNIRYYDLFVGKKLRLDQIPTFILVDRSKIYLPQVIVECNLCECGQEIFKNELEVEFWIKIHERLCLKNVKSTLQFPYTIKLTDSFCGVGMLMKLDCIGIRNMKLKIIDELLPSNPSVNLCDFDVANYDSFVQEFLTKIKIDKSNKKYQRVANFSQFKG